MFAFWPRRVAHPIVSQEQLIEGNPQSIDGLEKEAQLLEELPAHPNVARYFFRELGAKCARYFVTHYSSTLYRVIVARKEGIVLICSFALVSSVSVGLLLRLFF